MKFLCKNVSTISLSFNVMNCNLFSMDMNSHCTQIEVPQLGVAVASEWKAVP